MKASPSNRKHPTKGLLFAKGDLAILDENSTRAIVEVRSITSNGALVTIIVPSSRNKEERQVLAERLTTYSNYKHGKRTTDQP